MFVAAGLLAMVATAGGCLGSARPQVKVLGVSQAAMPARGDRTLVMFVEVVNPTQSELTLSRLEYELDAPSLFSTRGNVSLRRKVQPGSSAVVEIPVPLAREIGASRVPSGAPYELEGKLFARENRVERSWKVKVEGALSQGTASRLIRVHVADRAGR